MRKWEHINWWGGGSWHHQMTGGNCYHTKFSWWQPWTTLAWSRHMRWLTNSSNNPGSVERSTQSITLLRWVWMSRGVSHHCEVGARCSNGQETWTRTQGHKMPPKKIIQLIRLALHRPGMSTTKLAGNSTSTTPTSSKSSIRKVSSTKKGRRHQSTKGRSCRRLRRHATSTLKVYREEHIAFIPKAADPTSPPTVNTWGPLKTPGVGLNFMFHVQVPWAPQPLHRSSPNLASRRYMSQTWKQSHRALGLKPFWGQNRSPTSHWLHAVSVSVAIYDRRPMALCYHQAGEMRESEWCPDQTVSIDKKLDPIRVQITWITWICNLDLDLKVRDQLRVEARSTSRAKKASCGVMSMKHVLGSPEVGRRNTPSKVGQVRHHYTFFLPNEMGST